jgi:nucleoside-diphosphate-sugar epimerase
MNIIIIGGTGLIGSEAAWYLLESKNQVKTIALPSINNHIDFPKDMEIIENDYNKMTDDELLSVLEGNDCFLFASGIDERVEGKAPIYEMYRKYNIDPVKRFLKLCKIAKIKKVIILGSYFSYFNREWPELELYKNHPYIRSRVDQATEALKFDSKDMSVSVLELPYIFGTQRGRKPVWIILVKQILKMRLFTFYPKGGSTMITVKQVGQLINNIFVSDNIHGNIPVGYYNLTWRAMLNIFHEELKLNRLIVSIPKWLYRLGVRSYVKEYKRKGLEAGLNLNLLPEIMGRNAFIDNSLIKEKLGVSEDDIYQAISVSVRQSKDYLDGLENMLEMKFE